MNAELKNNWAAMCLAPYKVRKEVRNKFVACLIGDELASDEEFMEMRNGVEGTPRDGGCKFSFMGSCFHPFRPGSLVSAIFAHCFRGQSNAEELVKKETVDHLDNRKCCGCCMTCSKYLLDESAFNGLTRLYDDMFDRVHNGNFYGVKWEDFRERYKSSIDDVPYFDARIGDNREYVKYEDNIRAHFDSMAERHYHELEAAVMDITVPYDKRNGVVLKALSKVKFELATHFMTYWETEQYKNPETK